MGHKNPPINHKHPALQYFSGTEIFAKAFTFNRKRKLSSLNPASGVMRPKINMFEPPEQKKGDKPLNNKNTGQDFSSELFRNPDWAIRPGPAAHGHPLSDRAGGHFQPQDVHPGGNQGTREGQEGAHRPWRTDGTYYYFLGSAGK